MMIATIRPGSAFYGQTLSTLRYASRARDIMNAPTMHSDASSWESTGGPGKDSSALAWAYSTINHLRSQLDSRVSEFDRLKTDPHPRSPDAQRKLRSLKRKHATELIELKRELSGVVQSKGSELSEAKATAERLTGELEEFKSLHDKDMEDAKRKITEITEHSNLMVEEARQSLNDDTRRALKKLAKERKILKEKNERLENEVTTMRNELHEISVKSLSDSQRKTLKEEGVGGATSQFVGSLQSQLQTLRAGLEKAARQEDLEAEVKSWRARCREAAEHLDRMKRDAEASAKAERKMEHQIRTLQRGKDEAEKNAREKEAVSNHEIYAATENARELQANAGKLRQKYQTSKSNLLEMEARLKESELKNEQLSRELKHVSVKHADAEALQKQQEYQFEQEKKRMHQARMEAVTEKSDIEGRNEHLERENVRMKSELGEEQKKREYAERESARNVPLQSRLGKLSEENQVIKDENDSLRTRVRRFQAEIRNSASLQVEIDAIRNERDKISLAEGSMKAELHQLRKRMSAAMEEETLLRSELAAAKKLNEDLESALDKTKQTNNDFSFRIDESFRDNKELSAELKRVKDANEKMREDQEALGALCSSLKKTMEHLEKEKDLKSADHYSDKERHKEERKRLDQKCQALEREVSKLNAKQETLVHHSRELQDSINVHRGRSGALTGELNVAQESLARANAELKAENERRLSSEEKLLAEQRANGRLLKETEDQRAIISKHNADILSIRGLREADLAANATSMEASAAALKRERLSREAAEHGQEELNRKFSLVQASLVQETGARKGAMAARDAALMDAETLRTRLEEVLKAQKILKSEKVRGC